MPNNLIKIHCYSKINNATWPVFFEEIPKHGNIVWSMDGTISAKVKSIEFRPKKDGKECNTEIWVKLG